MSPQETLSASDSKATPTPSDSPEPTPVRRSLFDGLRADLPASLVVFLVALPLSLGIAAASGAPVMAGLIAAAVGGIVAGSLGGSALQVSGPAAGLTVVVAGLIEQFGWQVTCFITLGAGLVQILLGASRIGRAALAISPIVVHAMLAGIGVTIVLQQLHVLLGAESGKSALENIEHIPATLASLNAQALMLGGIVIVIMVAWKRLPAAMQKIPGALVAVILATLLSVLLASDVERISFSGSIFEAIALPQLPSDNWDAVLIGIVTVAMVASIESLLSAVAVDKMHTGPRTNFDRELIGQGSANSLSGLLGGLPITGVIVRSATNVEAGAQSRKSAVLHGIWILVFSVLFAAMLQTIPKAVLAGLLIVIGARLVKPADIRTALKTGDGLAYGITLLCVVFMNLLEGVFIGLALASAIMLWRVMRPTMRAEPAGADGSKRWRVVIEGSCSFLSLPRLTRVLNSVPSGTDVIVELHIDFLDHSVFETMNAWRKQHISTGGTVHFEEHGNTAFSDAASTPPKKEQPRTFPLAPRKAWQDNEALPPIPGTEDRPEPVQSLLLGIDKYHRRHAEHVLPHVEDLAETQNPDTLFLTCVDSRVNPNLITSSGPGDLLTLRNIGNVVCADGQDPSIESALSFAVQNLSITSIVICGHSNCGAMKAVLANPWTDLDSSERADRDALDVWIDHARSSYDELLMGHPVVKSAAAAGYGQLDQLSMVNVAAQMQKLENHTLLGPALASGRIHVTGLFYDISTARVLLIKPEGIEQLDPLSEQNQEMPVPS
jgi:carbonic anhydrase